jgi:HAE1 family hydrophobic/amphiphilic exporter-1
VRQKEKQLEMARNRRGPGGAPELEVLGVGVDRAHAPPTLLRLSGASDLARGDLNAVMVAPTDAPIEPTDALEFEDLPAEQQQVVREAVASRPEVRAIAWSEKIYDEAIGIYKADMQPRLDLNAAYGWSVREPGNFGEPNYKRWNLGVTLKVPVFDGWRTAGRVAQARADRARVGQDRVALETLIDLEAKQAVDRLRVAASVFRSAELNVGQARKALDMTEANYRLGAATSLDVLDAQAALTQAEFVRVEALHAHANARAGLRYVTGQSPLGDEGEAAPASPGAGAPSPERAAEGRE